MKISKMRRCGKSKIKFQPQVALILGSGLGSYAETMQVEETMEYGVGRFPVSTVAGPREDFIWLCRGVPVVAMQGKSFAFLGGIPDAGCGTSSTSDGNAGSKIVMLTNLQQEVW